jgi:hypothetical protein
VSLMIAIRIAGSGRRLWSIRRDDRGLSERWHVVLRWSHVVAR